MAKNIIRDLRKPWVVRKMVVDLYPIIMRQSQV